MTGRLEGELKIKELTDKKVNEMPEFVEDWVLNLRASRSTATTIDIYVNRIREYLSTINPVISQVKAEDLNQNNITEYYLSKETRIVKGEVKEMSDSFRCGVWFALNNFTTFMAKRGYIPYNFMSEIKKPKNNDLDRINKSRVVLTEEDFNNIIKAVKNGAGTHRARARQEQWKERDLAILVLFMETGMRKTALCQINIEDIDFSTGILVVRDKGRKTHEYKLGRHAMKCVNAWLDKREEMTNDDNGPLFISNRGTRISGEAVQALVRKYTAAVLEKGVSPHKLRAGFCTILYSKNPDLLFVSRAVGHSDTKVTERYISTGNKDKAKANKIMDGLINL